MAGMKNSEYLLTVQEAAELLGTNPQTIRSSIDNGSFPFGVSYTTDKNKKVYKISKRKVFNFLGINETEEESA